MKKTKKQAIPRFRSKFEAAVAADLVNRDLPFEYEATTVAYIQKRKYTPDFKVVGPNGKVFYVETKGYFTSADRSKHILVRTQNPTLDIRFVFQKASVKLNRRSEVTYGEWATAAGFLWAEKSIPDEWVKKCKIISLKDPRPT